jgi:hypothetical protein
MSPRWTLSLCAGALLSCAETEPAEIPPSSNLPEPGTFETTRTVEMAEAQDELEERREAQRTSTLTMATALLREVRDRRGEQELLPAVGMAVLEITQRGIELHVTADLPRGTHAIHLLEEVIPCGEVTAESPRYRTFGVIQNRKPGRATFERRVAEGDMDEYERMVGRPLVLSERRGRSTVCGVLRETSAPEPTAELGDLD